MSGMLIQEFDVWRAGYGDATVAIYKAGTTELATVYYDFAVTQVGTNPVRLLTRRERDCGSGGDIDYGKFPRSLYVTIPYDIRITDTGENTGTIDAPDTNLEGKDVSLTVVKPTGGTAFPTMANRLGQEVWAIGFGAFGSDEQANTAILAAAIGEGSARGGARVMLPAGTIPFLTLDIPNNVTVVGRGKSATILQSRSGEAVVTFSGNYCGLEDLTLDGVQKVTNSIGLKGVMRTGTRLKGVRIKRFARNVEFRGGSWFDWEDVDIEDGNDGPVLMGDSNSGGVVTGGALEHFTWNGGKLIQHSAVGLRAIYEDFPIRHIQINNVEIKDNTETAVELTGAQFVGFDGCSFEGNTRWLVVADDDLSTVPARRDNTVQVLTIEDCEIQDGIATFAGECETILFDRCRISNVTVNLISPVNTLLVRDCVEREVTLAGITTAWARWVTQGSNIVIGQSTDDTGLTAWRERLDYGEVMNVIASVLAVGQNHAKVLNYVRAAFYTRAGLVLPYAGQTANFTLGNRITGGLSGASGTLQAQSDSGATGTLTLINVEGTFQDDEALSEDGGAGNGFVNLPVTSPNVAEAYDDDLIAAVGAAGTAGFAVSGEHVIFQVFGGVGETTNWTIRIDAVKSRA